MWALVREDVRNADGGLLRVAAGVLIGEPLMAVLLYRVAHALYRRRRLRYLAWVLRAVIVIVWSADIHPGAVIGPRLKFAHTVGIVVGGGVRAGADLELYAGIALGHRGDWRFPDIGNNVTIYTGACVLGAVRIGDYAEIGANAVVIDDVPTGHVAIGVPARSRPHARAATQFSHT